MFLPLDELILKLIYGQWIFQAKSKKNTIHQKIDSVSKNMLSVAELVEVTLSKRKSYEMSAFRQAQ